MDHARASVDLNNRLAREFVAAGYICANGYDGREPQRRAARVASEAKHAAFLAANRAYVERQQRAAAQLAKVHARTGTSRRAVTRSKTLPSRGDARHRPGTPMSEQRAAEAAVHPVFGDPRSVNVALSPKPSRPHTVSLAGSPRDDIKAECARFADRAI